MSRLRSGLWLLCCLVLTSNPSASHGAPVNKAARTDHYNDALPEGAIARLGTVRFRTGAQIVSVAYSPDGRLLAASDYERTVCVWQSSTGKELFRFRLRPPRFSSAADLDFSPDGKTLAVAGKSGEGGIRLWDMTTGKEHPALRTASGESADSVAFSPDGEYLAAICRTQSGREYHRRIRMWHNKSGKEVAGFESPPEDVLSVAFARDSKSLALGLDGGEVCVCETSTGRKLRTVRRYKGHFAVVAFSPDGILASATQDETVIRLWDATTGREKQVLRGHKGFISTLVFSPDGKRLFSSGSLNGILVWNLARGELIREIPRLGTFGNRCMSVSPDGRTLVVASGRFALIRWDLARGVEAVIAPAHTDPVTFVAFTPDQRVVTGGMFNDACVWDAATGRQLVHIRENDDQIRHLALSPDGRTVAGSLWKGAIRLWDLGTGKERGTLTRDGGSAPSLCFAPDGKTLAAGYQSRTLVFWDLAYRQPFHQFPITPRFELRSLAFSPDGKRLASFGDVWDAADGRHLGELRTEDRVMATHYAIRFSPDGALLAAPCNSRGVAVWDARTRRLIGRVASSGGMARSVAFSPDGRLLACGKDDGAVELWEILTWKILDRRQGPYGEVLALAFSPDGRLLASGHEDTTALIWDVSAIWSSPPITATAAHLDALWTQLGSDQPADAWRAMAALRRVPDKTVPLLHDCLRPAQKNKASVRQLLTDLDADSFTVRENAVLQLEKRGPDVAPALRETLAACPSPEVKRRVKMLLGNLGRRPSHELLTSQERRSLRAITLLEQIGTPEAKRHLRTLGQGAADAPLTRAARAALQHLTKRSEAP